MGQLITQSELARRTGKSQPYIAKLIKQGKLKINKDKLLDYEACAKVLGATDPAREESIRVTAEYQKGVPRDQRSKPKDDDIVPDDQYKMTMMYNKAKTAEKMYTAKLRELEAKEKSGELIRRDEVQRQAAEIGNLITSKLYNMVHKVSPLLVGVESQTEARSVLEDEIEALLENLHRMKDEF